MHPQERRDGALRPRYNGERSDARGKLTRMFMYESIGEHNERNLSLTKNDRVYKRKDINEVGISKKR